MAKSQASYDKRIKHFFFKPFCDHIHQHYDQYNDDW